MNWDINWKGLGELFGTVGGKTLEFNKIWPRARLTGPSSTNPCLFRLIFSYWIFWPISLTTVFFFHIVQLLTNCSTIFIGLAKGSLRNEQKKMLLSCNWQSAFVKRNFIQSFPIQWAITINFKEATTFDQIPMNLNQSFSNPDKARRESDPAAADEFEQFSTANLKSQIANLKSQSEKREVRWSEKAPESDHSATLASPINWEKCLKSFSFQISPPVQISIYPFIHLLGHLSMKISDIYLSRYICMSIQRKVAKGKK